jgi:hypothetical protein
VGDKWILKACQYLTYDGINLWITSRVDNTSGTDSVALVKIDSAKLWRLTVDTGVRRSLAELTPSVFATPVELKTDSPTTFDGRDVWAISNTDASGTTSGYINRLPLALIRS